MWLIFIMACIVVALAALFVIWIGSKVLYSIKKREKMDDVEYEIYKQAKKRIKKEMEKKE